MTTAALMTVCGLLLLLEIAGVLVAPLLADLEYGAIARGAGAELSPAVRIAVVRDAWRTAELGSFFAVVAFWPFLCAVKALWPDSRLAAVVAEEIRPALVAVQYSVGNLRDAWHA